MFTLPVAVMKSVAPAYSGTIFASGTRGTIIKSSNAGTSWVNISPQVGFDGNLLGLATNGTIKVAYGAYGYVAYSTDALNWTACPIDTVEPVGAIIYDTVNGVWIAAVRDRIYTSTNLLSWTARNKIVEFSDITAFASDGSKIVAVGASSLVATSTDGGFSWSVRSFNAAGTVRFNGVFFANSNFVAVGMGGAIQSSADGSTWTKRTSGVTAELSGVTYFSSMWVVTGANRTVLTSAALTSWSQVAMSVGSGTDNLRKIYSNGTTIVATSTNTTVVYRSGNGTTWYTTNMSAVNYSNQRGSPIFMDVIYDTVSSAWIGAGYCTAPNTFDTSALKSVIFVASDLTDTIPWTDISSSGSITGRSVKTFHSLLHLAQLGDNTIIAAGSGTLDLAYSSDNGDTWGMVNLAEFSPVAFNGSAPLNAMWLGQDSFIASAGNSLYRSFDLLNWTKVYELPSGGLFHPYKTGGFLGSLWLIPSKGGTLVGSIDGVTWVAGVLPTGGADIFQAVRGNGIYVVTSTAGRIFTSTDAGTWTLRQTSATSNFLNLTFDGAWFFAFTSSGQIFKSADGATWTLINTASASLFENGAQYEFGIAPNNGRLGIMPNQTGLYRTSDNLVFRATSLTVAATAFGTGFSSAFSGGLTASLSGVQWKSVEMANTIFSPEFSNEFI